MPQKVKPGDIPTTIFGKTGIEVSISAQGGARMDLHPDVATAAAHVRTVYDLGVTYFDCAHAYWGGLSEEAYGIGLDGRRKNVFLTTKSRKRAADEAALDLETSLRLLKTDYVDLWQIHAVGTQADIDQIMGPGGALEAFEGAKYSHDADQRSGSRVSEFRGNGASRGAEARRGRPGDQDLRQGLPAEIPEPERMPAIRVEPTGRRCRHLRRGHSGTDGRQYPHRPQPHEDVG